MTRSAHAGRGGRAAHDTLPGTPDDSAALARSLGVATDARGCIAGTDLVLRREGGRLELHDVRERHDRGVAVDFSAVDLRTGSGNLSHSQPLARAFGRRCRSILDATAGLGHDAFLLAAIGYRVLAVERSPVLFALLADGLARAAVDPRLNALLQGRMQARPGDARELLASGPFDIDAIYLDPMFPEKRKKSALAPKAIRWVRELAGDDLDASELLALALGSAPRVVVKRHHHAAPLPVASGAFAGRAPTRSARGKMVRYDVYLA